MDFLAGEYGGTGAKHRHQQVQPDLRARKARGCELAFAYRTEIIVEQADRLSRMVRQLLTVSRLESGTIRPRAEVLSLAPRVRRDLLEATEDSFDEVLATNLKGPYFLTQAAARWMAEHRAGKPLFNKLYNADKDHPVEVTGRKLRRMMKWINVKEIS